MLLVKIYDDQLMDIKSYLMSESRLGPIVDYLKAVKQDDFNGTWSKTEQDLFDNFSDAIPKDGT